MAKLSETELSPHEAVEYYERDAKSEPNNAQAHFNLGTAYYAAENFDAAFKEFQEAVALAPGIDHAHYFLGVLYAQRGDKVNARKELEQVLNSGAHIMLKNQAKLQLSHID